MKINPFEIEDFPLLAIGPGNFQVTKAQDVVSKFKQSQGIEVPDQLKIQMKVWDKNGKIGTCIDYIPYDLTWKLGKFLAAIGMERLAKTGDINPPLFEERTGPCTIKHDEYQGEVRSKIDNYIKKESAPEETPTPFDDDIPFG